MFSRESVRSVDTGLIKGFLKAQYGNSVTTWANSLATCIKVHAAHLFMKMYSNNASNIGQETLHHRKHLGSHVRTRSTAAITPLKCPLVWAQDFDCVHTFPSLRTFLINCERAYCGSLMCSASLVRTSIREERATTPHWQARNPSYTRFFSRYYYFSQRF